MNNKIYSSPEAMIVTFETQDIMALSLSTFDITKEDSISIDGLLG